MVGGIIKSIVLNCGGGMQRAKRQGYKFKDTKEGLKDIEKLKRVIDESPGNLKYQELIDARNELRMNPTYRVYRK